MPGLGNERWPGLGHMAGGLIATTADPSTYTTLFVADVATFALFIAVLMRMPSPAAIQAPPKASVGYRTVLSDIVFRRILALNFILVAAGIAVMMVLFPVFAKDYAGGTERGIGVAFFVNTLVIIIAQLPIAHWQEERRRMHAVALTAVVWIASCGVLFAGGAWYASGPATVLLFCVALGLFGIGECLYSTVLQGPLAADLAPPHARGRYMGLNNVSWQFGFMLGPALGSLVLAVYPLALWPLCALACLAAGLFGLSIEAKIPAEHRLTPRPG